MSNVETLRAVTFERRGFYKDALAGEAWLDEQETNFCEKPSTLAIPWYPPSSGFWPKAARFLNTFADGYRPEEDSENVMTSGVPVPQPVIRQVPRE
jgi:hypothetical protein